MPEVRLKCFPYNLLLMKTALPRELERIYDSVRHKKRKEMEPYLREFDFSKVDMNNETKFLLPKGACEAGKFLRAMLITKRLGRETREAVEAYRNLLEIPYGKYGYPFGDEIFTALLFPSSSRRYFFDVQKEEHVDGPSGRYVLTVPFGLLINLERRQELPDALVDVIDWGTGSVQKEFSLNKRYLSQFSG